MIRDCVGRKIDLRDIVLLVRHTDFGVKLRHFKVVALSDFSGEEQWEIALHGINHADSYAIRGNGSTCEPFLGREQRLYILSKSDEEFNKDRCWHDYMPPKAYMGWSCIDVIGSKKGT